MLVIAFTLSSLQGSYSQESQAEYYPIGTTWEEALINVQRLCGEYSSFYRVRSEVIGDTLVSGKTYKLIERKKYEFPSNPSRIGETDYVYICEENNQIYLSDKPKGYESETLIYDFDWDNIEGEFWCQSNLFQIGSFSQTEETLLDGNTYECLIHKMVQIT